MDESVISKRLKQLRKQNNLKLAEVAERTGLTKGYLSRIENSKNPPPISTLGRIAEALGVDITDLLPKVGGPVQDQELAISRKNQRKEIDKGGTPYGYIYEGLALEKKGKNMEPLLVSVGFDQKVDIQTDFRHQGEEFIFVLEGRMEFFFKGKSYILEQGDSAYFDADIPHSGRSLGKRKAKILIVIYAYKRV
jgi:transcriptional regulator with XRE-family HTH domain